MVDFSGLKLLGSNLTVGPLIIEEVFFFLQDHSIYSNRRIKLSFYSFLISPSPKDLSVLKENIFCKRNNKNILLHSHINESSHVQSCGNNRLNKEKFTLREDLL